MMTFMPWVTPFLFLRVAIHSAVRVFTGEADEIATQHLRLLRQSYQQTIKIPIFLKNSRAMRGGRVIYFGKLLCSDILNI
jgi:hypothetical protein